MIFLEKISDVFGFYDFLFGILEHSEAVMAVVGQSHLDGLKEVDHQRKSVLWEGGATKCSTLYF